MTWICLSRGLLNETDWVEAIIFTNVNNSIQDLEKELKPRLRNFYSSLYFSKKTVECSLEQQQQKKGIPIQLIPKKVRKYNILDKLDP